MKKLLIFILLLSPFSVEAATVSLEVQVLESSTRTPIENLVVRKQEGTSISQILVTNQEGKINSNFTFREDGTRLGFRINGNNVFIESISSTVGTLIILYDTPNQEITGVNYGGRYVIENQQILRETNYRLLLIYGFFTALLALILTFTRIFYKFMDQDIFKHK